MGSHLVGNLLDSGCETVVLDNFCSGKNEDVEEYIGSRRFHLIRDKRAESYASMSKAKKKLRFRPVFSTHEGLKKLVAKSSWSLS
jgi:hypothetical protein